MKETNTHSYRVSLKDGSVFIISDVSSFHFIEEGPIKKLEEIVTMLQFYKAEDQEVGHLVHANIQSITLA